MKTNKKELKNKMLSSEQAETVKEMIIASMKDVYLSAGSLPGNGFEQASGFVADKIIKNTQMALIQNNVYKKAVDESKPFKGKKGAKSSISIKLMSKGKQVGKTITKEVIKTKKNVRK